MMMTGATMGHGLIVGNLSNCSVHVSTGNDGWCSPSLASIFGPARSDTPTSWSIRMGQGATL